MTKRSAEVELNKDIVESSPDFGGGDEKGAQREAVPLPGSLQEKAAPEILAQRQKLRVRRPNDIVRSESPNHSKSYETSGISNGVDEKKIGEMRQESDSHESASDVVAKGTLLSVSSADECANVVESSGSAVTTSSVNDQDGDAPNVLRRSITAFVESSGSSSISSNLPSSVRCESEGSSSIANSELNVETENGAASDALLDFTRNCTTGNDTSSSCLPPPSTLTNTSTYENPFMKHVQQAEQSGSSSFFNSLGDNSSSTGFSSSVFASSPLFLSGNHSTATIDASEPQDEMRPPTTTPVLTTKADDKEENLFCDGHAKFSRIAKTKGVDGEEISEWVSAIPGKAEVNAPKTLEGTPRILFRQNGSGRLLLNTDVLLDCQYQPFKNKSVIFNGRQIDDHSKLMAYRLTFSSSEARDEFIVIVQRLQRTLVVSIPLTSTGEVDEASKPTTSEGEYEVSCSSQLGEDAERTV